MPEVVTAGQLSRRYRVEFMRLLRSERRKAELSFRTLARRCGCSHPHLVRSVNGDRLPRWRVVSAMLEACGKTRRELVAWRLLWETASVTQTGVTQDGVRYRSGRVSWSAIRRAWDEQVAAVVDPDPMLATIRGVVTVPRFGLALTEFADRGGPWSFRSLEALSGVSRSTLQGWFAGRRVPRATQLDQLLVALRASRAERDEFAAARTRIVAAGAANRRHVVAAGRRRLPDHQVSRPAPDVRTSCDGEPRHDGKRCVLPRSHRGPHDDGCGNQWVDGGILDGRRGSTVWNSETEELVLVPNAEGFGHAQ